MRRILVWLAMAIVLPFATTGAASAVSVTARDFAFVPDTIESDPGVELVVELANEGAQPHNIAFYREEGGPPVSAGSIGPIVPAGETSRMSFVTPGPGRYPFLCDVHPLEMTGTLVITGAGAAATSEGAPATSAGASTTNAAASTVSAGASATSPAPVKRQPLPLATHERIDPSDFRVTTFAAGLPYAASMQELADGSLLVAVNDPGGDVGYNASMGKLLRLVDADDDGVADAVDPVGILELSDADGPLVYRDLRGVIVQMRLHGDLLFLVTHQRTRSRIVVLRAGDAAAAPWTMLGTLDLAFPEEHVHDTYALAVREGAEAGSVEVYFNIGGRLNSASDTRPIVASGLLDATLVPESIHRLTLQDDGASIRATDVRLIAVGLRNAAGLAFHPRSGDLYLQDNGIDREDDPEEQLSPDELNVITADRLGREVVDFGFARDHVAYRTGERVGSGGEPPLHVFQPLPGSEAEGAAEIAFAPEGFPAGLDDGIFVGFHGRLPLAGIANEENPLRYVDLDELTSFDFVPNDAPDVGHLDSLLATRDSLFIADLNRTGQLNDREPDGVIHQVRAVRPE